MRSHVEVMRVVPSAENCTVRKRFCDSDGREPVGSAEARSLGAGLSSWGSQGDCAGEELMASQPRSRERRGTSEGGEVENTLSARLLVSAPI